MAVASQQRMQEREPGSLVDLALAISTAVTRGGELGAMLRSCSDELAHHLHHIACAQIWVRKGDVLELCAISDAAQPEDGDVSRIHVGEFTIGRIAASGSAYLTSDVQREFDAPDGQTVGESVTAFAGYPLVVERRVISVLALFANAPVRPRALSVIEPVAAVIA